MSHLPEYACPRTSAVLTVHLDGEVLDDQLDREEFGYAFLCEDSLHKHLRECHVCQRELQRARRLDAVLASNAGRGVADLALANHESVDELANRLLDQAKRAADRTPAMSDDKADDDAPEPTLAGGPSPRAANGNRSGYWIAATSLAAAGVIAWLTLLATPTTRPTPNASNPSEATEVAKSPAQPLPNNDQTARSTPTANRPAQAAVPSQPVAPSQRATPRQPGDASLPSGLAKRMRLARDRKLSNQRSATATELAARILDRDANPSARLAAARQLIQSAKTDASNRPQSTQQLLGALAAYGDLGEHELYVHGQLLNMLRGSRSMQAELQQRLLALLAERDLQATSPTAASTIIVAARVGTAKLDNALRRLTRRHEQVGQLIASSLRCGARLHGASELLLDCWRDQVAFGNQENTPRWAISWFGGQPEMLIAELARLRQTSNSQDARVRCCLAMGCATSDITLPALLQALRSPRRNEATAAAWGIAMLPHRVLKKLAASSEAPDTSTLRAILARAGLPQADRWIQHLCLKAPQLQLLRDGSLNRWPEAINWFQRGASLPE